MHLRYLYFLFYLLPFLNANCNRQKQQPIQKSVFVEVGTASWYGPGLHGKRTASGEKFDMNLLTAAHKKLEFGTIVRVTNLKNKKQVLAEILDRGPISKRKVLDLSKKAAEKIDLIQKGSAIVKIEIVGYKNMNSEALIKHYRNMQIIKLGKIIF